MPVTPPSYANQPINWSRNTQPSETPCTFLYRCEMKWMYTLKLSTIHTSITDTLLLQMNNGEHVYIINSVYYLSGG